MTTFQNLIGTIITISMHIIFLIKPNIYIPNYLINIMHNPFIYQIYIKTSLANFHSIYSLPKHTIIEHLYTTKDDTKISQITWLNSYTRYTKSIIFK
ncbi:hypothetical protein F383_36626 [Gossypium arboreum]|uniref:Uncharacterized protein n=1 Tax=Gossypium arboreum TaxID=29729 RepID=A0A0B0M9X9_GOSAR|nr:hypothetical protein F383_36626 [Gossypium arboreum]